MSPEHYYGMATIGRHREPKLLNESTVIVDTKLGMIYRVSGETLYLIPRVTPDKHNPKGQL